MAKEVESYSFHWDSEELEKETVFSKTDADLCITYYYDLDGQMIEDTGPNGNHRDELHVDSVKIVHRVERWTDPETGNEIGTFAYDELIIDGKTFKGVMDVFACREYKGVVYIKTIVGTG